MTREELKKEIKAYRDKGYNHPQLIEMEYGLETGLTIEEVLKFDWKELRKIRLEKMFKIDPSIYYDLEANYQKMKSRSIKNRTIKNQK